MALTLDDGPTLDVGSVASPRWQRFAGGRRLAHVGYRRRVIRVALGMIGAALVGGTLSLGVGRTLVSTGFSSFGAFATQLTREATSTSEAATRSVFARWDALTAWSRLDTAVPRQSPDVQASGINQSTMPMTSPVSGATREASVAATGDPYPAGVLPSGLAAAHTATGANPGAITSATGPAVAGGATPIAGVARASPTIGARQPAGTPLPVVTATLGVPAPTATAPRPAPSATARPAGPVSHQVVAGDTLWGIATRYGTSVDAIMRANRLPDPDTIVPGARLVIPR
jgi:LysM repeat protein